MPPNPYNYHIAVRDDEMFFGREEILDRLAAGLSAPVPLSAAVFGGRRCGKTSLLSKLGRMLGTARAAGERRLVPCSLDLQRGRPLASSDDFFLWVLEELAEAWERLRGLPRGAVVDVLQTGYRDEARRGPVDAFVRAFRTLDTGGERLRLVILLDESEQILTVGWGDDLRPNLRTLLSNSSIVEDVALVMAGSTQMYQKVTERDSPLENILDRYPLPALAEDATIALARRPNEGRLAEGAAAEVWRQSGGQPCVAQYILHELWEGIAEATAEDVQAVAETFDERTRHCGEWARTLGPDGAAVYRFLVEQEAPAAYTAVRQRFGDMAIAALQGTLDALVYHGLVRCLGHGRHCQYQVAGQVYRDWFLAAGKFDRSPAAAPAEPDYIGALQRMRAAIEQHAPGCRESFLVYENRLRENLAKEAQTGSNETLRSVRSEIVAGLNRLAQQAGLAETFSDLTR